MVRLDEILIGVNVLIRAVVFGVSGKRDGFLRQDRFVDTY